MSRRCVRGGFEISRGTDVAFEIWHGSCARLELIFEALAPQEYDYRFEKTRVFVKLLQRSYVSRSEAKRLLLNLDRFSEVELDMQDVASVGQGFANEIFRVHVDGEPERVLVE